MSSDLLDMIKIGEYADGIRINSNYYESSMPLSTIKDITKALDEINRFHEITNQEITFTITNLAFRVLDKSDLSKYSFFSTN